MSREPNALPISIESSMWAKACARISAEGLHSEPNLYSWSWKRLGLIDPERMPKRRSSACTTGTSLRPLGKSHNTCRARVGVTPVSRFTSAASANFSSMVVAAAACTNLPKRVPVFANPHEGISMWKLSSALNASSRFADSVSFIIGFLLPDEFFRFSIRFWSNSLVMHQDHMQKTWPVDALDACHFNVCRGARPGDIGSQCRNLVATPKVLWQRLHHLARAQDAKMPVR